MGKIYYAGIGSRNTPKLVLKWMTELSGKLESLGWILRSGGADGADSAFELGVVDKSNKQIFYAKDILLNRFENANDAIDIAKKIHPNPYALRNPTVLALISRNTYQVLGSTLSDPSSLVICWTDDGQLKGGTAQAIRLAEVNNIPVINLGNPVLFNKLINSDDPVNDLVKLAKEKVSL